MFFFFLYNSLKAMIIPGMLSQKGQKEREATVHKICLTVGRVPRWAVRTSTAPCFRGTPFQPPSVVCFTIEHGPQGQGDCTPSTQSSPFWMLIQERGLPFPICTKSVSRAYKDFFASLKNIPGVCGPGWVGQLCRVMGRKERWAALTASWPPLVLFLQRRGWGMVTVFSFPNVA